MTYTAQAATFGELVGAAKARARLSFADLSEALSERGVDLSTQFLHDVVLDRRPLPPRVAAQGRRAGRRAEEGYWTALCAVLPGLTVRALAEARARTGTVRLDARQLTEEQRATVADALVREAEGV